MLSVFLSKRKDYKMFYNTENLKDNEIYLKLRKTCDAQPEKSWLPAYYFDICLLDGTKLGVCDLRIGHNTNTYIGGNIGYVVDEPYRGHHYAMKACKLLFNLAKMHKMDYLIITCKPDNIPSYRTCELLGGDLIEVKEVPQGHDLRRQGYTDVNIYRFDLD